MKTFVLAILLAGLVGCAHAQAAKIGAVKNFPPIKHPHTLGKTRTGSPGGDIKHSGKKAAKKVVVKKLAKKPTK